MSNHEALVADVRRYKESFGGAPAPGQDRSHNWRTPYVGSPVELFDRVIEALEARP